MACSTFPLVIHAGKLDCPRPAPAFFISFVADVPAIVVVPAAVIHAGKLDCPRPLPPFYFLCRDVPAIVVVPAAVITRASWTARALCRPFYFLLLCALCRRSSDAVIHAGKLDCRALCLSSFRSLCLLLLLLYSGLSFPLTLLWPLALP